MYNAPIYAWILVLIGAIGFSAMTVVALDRGAIMAGLGRRGAAGVAAASGVALGGWLVLSGVLAGAGAFQSGFLIAFAVVLPTLLLATRIPVVSRILAQPGAIAGFTLPHALRVVGVVFLLLMAQGHLPAGFALPAGLGDIAVGLAAPFVARDLARSIGGAASDAAIARAKRLHLFGLLDLVIAVSAAFVFSPAALLSLPLALVPTMVVPLAAALHLVSLGQLRAAARSEVSAGGWRPTGQLGPVRS